MPRIEKDFLGELEVPGEVYYGVQTMRALENFKITDIPIAIEPRFVAALGYVKKAAALANLELGSLPNEIGPAIIKACDAVIAGELDQQFVVDVIQGGAGTSTNMNANEVIANRALEELGQPKGAYEIVHPNNHVNCSQSTNDAYPTALRVALLLIIPDLADGLQELSAAFRQKADEFKSIGKIGRTQLQDAVPMTLGQEFAAFANTIVEDVERLVSVKTLFYEVNLGATAIGTGLNTPPGYAAKAVTNLAQLTGLPFVSSVDLIEATWDAGAYVQLSGVLRRIAVKLSKICNDLRLLSSGPRTGFNEINLPPMQPGSSIMPGKVNPVIPEVVNQIAFQAMGMDVAIAMAAEAGQLQLNAMEPLIAYNLFSMLESLKRGCRALALRCVQGITANPEVCARHLNNSLSVAAVLNTLLGYEKSCALAKEATECGSTIRELVIKKGIMDEKQFDELLGLKSQLES